MTEAPRLSEEVRISPMIEEKRGTQIHTGAARGRRDERRSEKRWTRGRVGRSIPIGVHARRSPRRYREMAGIWKSSGDLGWGCYYEHLKFRDELCREMRFASSTIDLDGLLEERIIGTNPEKSVKRCTLILYVIGKWIFRFIFNAFIFKYFFIYTEKVAY